MSTLDSTNRSFYPHRKSNGSIITNLAAKRKSNLAYAWVSWYVFFSRCGYSQDENDQIKETPPRYMTMTRRYIVEEPYYGLLF